MQPCCTRDEGRSLGLGLQDQGPNHRKLLWSNGRGGERCGKGGQTRQVYAGKTNASEPLMTCRKRRDVTRAASAGLPASSAGPPCFCITRHRRGDHRRLGARRSHGHWPRQGVAPFVSRVGARRRASPITAGNNGEVGCSGAANRSQAHVEPVSSIPKRKLENANWPAHMRLARSSNWRGSR